MAPATNLCQKGFQEFTGTHGGDGGWGTGYGQARKQTSKAVIFGDYLLVVDDTKNAMPPATKLCQKGFQEYYRRASSTLGSHGGDGGRDTRNGQGGNHTSKLVILCGNILVIDATKQR